MQVKQIVLKYNQYQLIKEEKKKMWFIEFQIITKYQDIYNCGRLLHHHNSQGFHVRFYPMNSLSLCWLNSSGYNLAIAS